MRITVLGATGGIGRAIVTELSARDHEVTAASRGVDQMTWPDGVQPAAVDLRDQVATTTVCQGADVVVMAAQVPYTGWATELTPLFDAAVDAAAASDAKPVVVDNLYAYGSPGTPITAAAPEAATAEWERKRRPIAATDGRHRVEAVTA